MNNPEAKKVFFNNRLLIGKRKVRGFTLLEMLVVLAIMAIIATLILVRFREGQKTYVLSQAAQKLVGDIREAQNMAVTGAEVKKPDGTDYDSIGGYGIYIIDAKHYRLFMNEKSNPSPNIFCPIGIIPEHEIKTVKLPDDITIDKLDEYVFYVPPIPDTCVERNPGFDEITFTLAQDSSVRTVKVYVNRYGIVEIR